MAVTEKGKNRLLKFHGLDPEKHTDHDVDEAIANALTPDDLEELENRAREGDEARAALADATLEKYGPRIGRDEKARAFYRDGLLQNREGTLAALDALPEPGAGARRGPLHNRALASSPAALERIPETEARKEKARATAIANRAKQIQNEGPKDSRGKPTITFNAAFNQAERDIEAQQERK